MDLIKQKKSLVSFLETTHLRFELIVQNLTDLMLEHLHSYTAILNLIFVETSFSNNMQMTNPVTLLVHSFGKENPFRIGSSVTS